MNVEIAQHFFLYKQIGLVVAFTISTGIQMITPHHADLRSDFKNWRVNLTMAVFNAVALTLLAGGTILTLANWCEQNQIGILNHFHVSKMTQTIATIFILDFTAYIWHRANHRWPILWRFHKVHHSDMNFDTSTAIRFHIGELFFSFLVRLAVVAAFGLPIPGLLLFELIYQWANFFEHGNIRLPAWLENGLGLVFVTPALHRKHHSTKPSELNSNYSTIFSFWDRLGSSLTPSHSTEVYPLGLPGQSKPWTMKEILFKPFWSI